MKTIKGEIVRVLIVDDVPELRRVLRLILELEARVHVLEAESGEQALDVLAREDVDLVVMDHGLPGMSGVECARVLRRREPVPAVVAFTSLPDAREAFLSAGVVRHFDKPDVDTLVAFVHEMAGSDGYRGTP